MEEGAGVAPKGDVGPATAARIVRTIWLHPHISRIDIAERLSLDKSTVTNQVSRLIALGLVEEIEEGSASARGGRRPIHLGISRSYGLVIGIEMQVESWLAVAVDLSGAVLGEARGRCRIEPDKAGEAMLKIVKEAKAKLCAPSSRLLGIGVGTGGLVDPKKSLIRYSVPLRLSSPLDFGKVVASRLEVPCLIENDANCCAWGELAFNRDDELRDFLFLLAEYRHDEQSLGMYGGLGVGFGIVLGGKVYAGAHGNAGEFRSVLCDGPGDLQFSLPKEELQRLESEGATLGKAADELARNVAMLVNTFDIERVYVGGDIENLDVDFPALLRRRLEENWMYPFPKDVRILNSSLKERAVAYGAAGMILDRLISGKGLLSAEAPA